MYIVCVCSTDVNNTFGTGDNDRGIGVHNTSAVEWNHFTFTVLARLHSVGRSIRVVIIIIIIIPTYVYEYIYVNINILLLYAYVYDE